MREDNFSKRLNASGECAVALRGGHMHVDVLDGRTENRKALQRSNTFRGSLPCRAGRVCHVKCLARRKPPRLEGCLGSS